MENRRVTKKKTPGKSKKGVYLYRALVAIFVTFVLVIGAAGTYLYFQVKNSEVTSTEYQITTNDMYDNTTKGNTQERAEAVATKFAVDFYTFQYKQSRGQIGIEPLIYPNDTFVLDFNEYVMNTFYAQLDQLALDYGAENLPAVSSATVTNTTKLDDYVVEGYELDYQDVYEVEIELQYVYSDKAPELETVLNMPTKTTVTVAYNGDDYYVIGVK